MIYAVTGGLLCFWASLAVWWLYRQGRLSASGEYSKKLILELQGKSKAAKRYFKTVDKLAKKKESLKNELDLVYNGTDIGPIVRVLTKSRGKTRKAASTS